MFTSGWQWVIRVNSFVRKEVWEILRQPRLMLTLVLGPFLILLAFGAGLREDDPAIRTAFIAPDDSRLSEQVREFAEAQRSRLTVVGVTQDPGPALSALRTGDLDMVVVFPEDAADTVRDDEQAIVTLYHDQLDPLEVQAIELFARTAVDEINQQVLRTIVQQGQDEAQDVHEHVADARDRVAELQLAMAADDDAGVRSQQELLRQDVAAAALVLAPTVGVLSTVSETVGDAEEDELLTRLAAVESGTEQVTNGEEEPDSDEVAALEEDLAGLEAALGRFRSLSPFVVVSPFEDQTEFVGAGEVQLTDYYAPAVMTLLLQHLAITVIALSLVREEQLGTTELFRVAPLRPFETLLGKYLAHFVIGMVVAAVLSAVLILALGVPVAGSWSLMAATIAAVLLAAIGFGFVIALASRSDSQAVQYAMMVLLASVFFSGFLLTLERFVPVMRTISWLLPVTYGTALLRDIMLRGTASDWWLLLGLVLVGLALFGGNWLLLRRRLRHG